MIDQTKKLIYETIQSLDWKVSPSQLRIFWNNKNLKTPISSNLAFLVSSQLQTTPFKAAELFVKGCQSFLSKHEISSVDASPQGFINFHFSSSFLNKIVAKVIIEGANFGRQTWGKQKSVLYEWISANPTGNFHIGHLRNAIIGDSVVRLLNFVGFKVTSEFYINDAGKQMTAAGETLFFYYQKHFSNSYLPINKIYPETDYLAPTQKFIATYKDKFVQEGWHKQSVRELFIRFTRDYFLGRFAQACTKLGIQFQRWYSEKYDIYESKKIPQFLSLLNKKSLSEKKDGAIWFLARKFGFEDNVVLVKKTGEPTYFLSDWIYHDDKFRRGFEYLYDLWGADHDSHMKRIKSGLGALGHPDNFEVDIVQIVSLLKAEKILKLSKREGNVVSWEDFVRVLGPDFARFMLMTRKRTKSLLLDLNLAVLKNAKNPVFYVQYAHARACQLLAKFGPLPPLPTQFDQLGGDNNFWEQQLIFDLHQFALAIKNAAQNREPHYIVEYLIGFSKKFHSYYQNTQILKSSPDLLRQKIYLTQAVKKVLLVGLNLLGVNAPVQM